MTLTPDLEHHIQARLCCPSCNAIAFACPSCGELHELAADDPLDPADLPVELSPAVQCDCGDLIHITVVGYSINPTGERPAAEVLSDCLPALEKAWAATT